MSNEVTKSLQQMTKDWAKQMEAMAQGQHDAARKAINECIEDMGKSLGVDASSYKIPPRKPAGVQDPENKT